MHSTQETITVYSKPNCIQCDLTIRALQRAALPHTVVDITEQPEALTLVKELGYLAAPVVTIRNNNNNIVDHWAGFQPDRIKQQTLVAA